MPQGMLKGTEIFFLDITVGSNLAIKAPFDAEVQIVLVLMRHVELLE